MDKTNILLERAGYSEGRNVDISAVLLMYDKNGYQCNAKQKQFLEKFAYLEIHYIHPIWKQDMTLRLDPIKAQNEITMDVVEEYNDFLQDDLLIIGEIDKENMTLFLSEKGFYYTGYDDCLINWGDNFEIMLNKITSGEKGELLIIG